MIACVLFDLDGTLADTVSDLTAALNLTLRRYGGEELSAEMLRPYVSLGANAMLKLAFSVDEDAPDFANLRRCFLENYRLGAHANTRAFPGIATVLDHLDEKNVTWGIVTNKSECLARQVMQRLKLDRRAACIVGGDSTDFKKPHPRPLQYACEQISRSAGVSVYVGDTRSDIEAGRAAGMKTLLAGYGYIAPDDRPETWNADGEISNPEEIIPWLQRQNGARGDSDSIRFP